MVTSRVPSGTTHGAGGVEQRAGAVAEALLQQPALVDAPLEGLGDDGRLLEDLLEHEMAVGPLVGGLGRGLDPLGGTLDGPPVRPVDGGPVRAHLGQLALLQEQEAAGVGQEGVAARRSRPPSRRSRSRCAMTSVSVSELKA